MGVVMGIGFDSSNLTWYLPEEKANRLVSRCIDLYNSKLVSLKQMEKVMGSVNDLAQMAPFVKFYKSSGNETLRSFKGDYNTFVQVGNKLKSDLLVISKIANTARCNMPIPTRPHAGPLTTLTFYSDAAGASYSMVKGERVYHSNESRGVACIGGDNLNSIWIWTRLQWPKEFITSQKDEQGKSFGSKSTTLECIGLLLPLISFPEKVAGRFIKFRIDNAAVSYGWANGHVKFDSSATEVLKAVNIAASYLGTKIYVEHVPRMSEDLAVLADKLSRVKCDDRAPSHLYVAPKTDLKKWFKNPSIYNGLSELVLNVIKCMCPE